MKEPIKNVPQELRNERAFVVYLHCNSLTEVSNETGMNLNTINYLHDKHNWAERREEHFNKVRQSVNEDLENLAIQQANLASKALAKLDKLLDVRIEDIEVRSLEELFNAFNTGIDALQKLVNAKPADKETISQTVNISFENEEEEAEFSEIMNDAWGDL